MSCQDPIRFDHLLARGDMSEREFGSMFHALLDDQNYIKIFNLQHARLLHAEIFAEVHMCWKNWFRLLWTFQH